MNLLHRWLCRSSYWRKVVEERLLPWALEGIDLGPDVLEIGSGPGVTAAALHIRTHRLTCVEIDAAWAKLLARKTRGRNVNVVQSDASDLAFSDTSFSAVVCFTMLHHVAPARLQDRVFSEVYRVLKPGGVFAGTDCVGTLAVALLHIHDTLLLVDPLTLQGRLEAVGFSDVVVDIGEQAFRFRGSRPQVAQRKPSRLIDWD